MSRILGVIEYACVSWMNTSHTQTTLCQLSPQSRIRRKQPLILPTQWVTTTCIHRYLRTTLILEERLSTISILSWKFLCGTHMFMIVTVSILFGRHHLKNMFYLLPLNQICVSISAGLVKSDSKQESVLN